MPRSATNLTALDPAKIKALYDMRFLEEVISEDEHTVHLKTTILGLYRSDVFGRDVQQLNTWQMLHQDDIATGEQAWCLVMTYNEADYTFQSSVGHKIIVAVCANELDAYQLRERIYDAINHNEYVPLPGDGDSKYDVVAMTVQ